MEPIVRTYPGKKDTDVYTRRYTAEDFDNYDRIAAVPENYEKWQNGINYRTNRKITIGGRTHTSFGYANFYISVKNMGRLGILFTVLAGINRAEYLEDTEQIKYNVHTHNECIADIVAKINALEKWTDYVEFDNRQYGLPHVCNDIHRENDCGGTIIADYYERCHCSSCENWFGCSRREGTQYYRCGKCGYTYG